MHDKSRTRCLNIRASGESSDDVVSVSPLSFESPVGQFLAQILQTHRHLLLAAADQQLENLQTERDAEKEKISSLEDLLYKYVYCIQASVLPNFNSVLISFFNIIGPMRNATLFSTFMIFALDS